MKKCNLIQDPVYCEDCIYIKPGGLRISPDYAYSCNPIIDTKNTWLSPKDPVRKTIHEPYKQNKNNDCKYFKKGL